MSSSSSSSSSSSGFDVSRLNPDAPSSALFSALVELRTRHMRDPERHKVIAAEADRSGLVSRLVSLLGRPNSKIVDVTLSVLANLLLTEGPRKALRQRGHRGIPILVGVLSTLGEEAILSRAARAVANAAQDHKNAEMLHKEDAAEVLLKVLGDAKDSKTRQVIVRALRILGSKDDHKRRVIESGVVPAVTAILVAVPEGEDEDLLKAACKCLAHFTHGCSAQVFEQVRGDDSRGLRRLSDLTEHPKRSVWEAALACLVNLSHLAYYRPVLGNAGSVYAIVRKLESSQEDMTDKEVAHSVTALCLYCRESVNRMKLRECGGLRLFVRLLGDAARTKLHDRVVNSLLQYSYDDASMAVLQAEGLVPRLVALLEEFTEKNGSAHDCAKEICKEEEEDKMSSVHDDEEEGKEKEVEGETADGGTADGEKEDGEAGGGGAEGAGEPSKEEPEEGEIVGEGPDRKKEEEKDVDDSRRFRVNSPSYQAVQHEFQEYLRIRQEQEQALATAYSAPVLDVPWSSDSPANSAHQSPDRSPFAWSSPGYSPAHSSPASTSAASSHYLGSPGSRSFSPSPPGSPFSSEPSQRSDASPAYSPFFVDRPNSPEESAPADDATKTEEDDDEEKAAAYSPVEHFSDDDAGAADGGKPVPSTSKGATALPSSSPLSKRRKVDGGPSPPAKLVLPSSSAYKSIFSPTYEASFNSYYLPGPSSAPVAGPSSEDGLESWRPMERPPVVTKERKKEDTRVGWILQILSRLSQAERPHEDMSDLKTTQVLIRYLCKVKEPLPRAGRILARLSKNLYCVMSFVFQRHLSWLKLELDRRPTLQDCMCQQCRELFVLRSNVTQNVTLLAESGYAEGQMCHVLMRGSRGDRRRVAVSTPMLVRSRRLLRNILLTHEGLETLMEVLEAKGEDDEDDDKLFGHAVLSCNALSAHLGVVAPDLKLEDKERGQCRYGDGDKDEQGDEDDDVVVFVLDDETEVTSRRSRLSDTSGFFSAMFGGSFAESDRRRVPLPGVGAPALRLLLHHLYGCRWCPAFKPDLEVPVLLELVALSDQYLLPELNQSVAHEIVQRCLKVDQVAGVYERSLQGRYQVGGCEESLSACCVNYLLVGAMAHDVRVGAFRELMASKMASDFADDVAKVLREKLAEGR